MKSHYHMLTSLAFVSIVLTACIQLTSNAYSAGDLSPTEQAVTVILGTTGTATPSNTGGETTEPLQLNVEKVEATCQIPGQSFQLKFIFNNLTSDFLWLQTRFYLSDVLGHGDVTYEVLNADKTPLPLANALFVETVADWNVPDNFAQIPALGQVETNLEFRLPAVMLSQSQYVPIPAGNYLLRFFYTNVYRGESNEVWAGEIASNYVEICTLESK